MKTIQTLSELRAHLQTWRRAGQTIAFVPTMGNLHAGHLNLMQIARQHADKVVASIFVNPLQFGPQEDFDRYPRTESADAIKLTQSGVDLLFLPTVADLFPYGSENTTFVEVPALSYQLCGQSRPGHFRGVTTIVTKLFNCVQPDVVILGEKDWQQLVCIKAMTAHLNMPIQIIGAPTVRETDGLAMSSRNQYLTPEERVKAPVLYQLLQQMQTALQAGDKAFDDLIATAKHALTQQGFQVDYIAICHASTLLPAQAKDNDLIILAAAFLGKTRLIDNLHCLL